MRLKLDENLPPEAREILREAGHDALTIGDQELGGVDDDNVAEVCRREGRALITLDVDFANIRAYPPEEYPGIIVLRPGRQSKPRVLSVVERIPSNDFKSMSRSGLVATSQVAPWRPGPST